MRHLELPEIWDICIDKIYDREKYADGLTNLLQANGITPQSSKRILDAACGTGFPAIELIERGYDIVCSDGSLEMGLFCQQKTNGKLIPHIVRWEELGKYFLPNSFDAVLMRGDSLPYIASWYEWKDYKPDIIKSEGLIFNALKSVNFVLKDGGLFYFDLFPSNEKPYKKDLGVVLVDCVEENWFWEINHFLENRERVWTIDRKTKGGGSYSYSYIISSYLVNRENLMKSKDFIDTSYLALAGFEKVREVKVEGEDNYEVYLANKKEDSK